MTEKDINIEDEETLNEAPVEETDKEAEASENPENSEDSENSEEQDPLEKAQAEIAELKNQLLYKVAEFENYRKRTLKERAELILNGGEKFITSILPVLDDMERALKNMKSADDVNAVLEGVELIYKKFMDILAKQGVSIIETKEADFDVDVHEAVAQLPAPTPELKGKVMDCTLTGYKLNEKVIRHAQVVVGV